MTSCSIIWVKTPREIKPGILAYLKCCYSLYYSYYFKIFFFFGQLLSPMQVKLWRNQKGIILRREVINCLKPSQPSSPFPYYPTPLAFHLTTYEWLHINTVRYPLANYIFLFCYYLLKAKRKSLFLYVSQGAQVDLISALKIISGISIVWSNVFL